MSHTQKATLNLYRSFLHVARQWPQDKLRKELQFRDALRAATHRAFLRNPPAVSQLTDRTEEAENAANKIRISGVYAPRTQSQNADRHRWAASLSEIDDEKVLEGGKNLRTLTEQEYQYAKRSLTSLQHLLNNRPSQKFPTPEEVLEPPSMPSYYANLRKQVSYIEQGKEIPAFTPMQKLKIFFGAKPHQV